MNRTRSPRIQLLRHAAVLQLKLLVDGMRDALLIPVSLVATAMGLLRSGENPEREFLRVLKMGRRSERWINLFGQQAPIGRRYPSGSMDQLLDRVEAVVMDQYRKGHTADEARTAITEALQQDKGQPAAEQAADNPASEK